jgi:hypothetical protein
VGAPFRVIRAGRFLLPNASDDSFLSHRPPGMQGPFCRSSSSHGVAYDPPPADGSLLGGGSLLAEDVFFACTMTETRPPSGGSVAFI